MTSLLTFVSTAPSSGLAPPYANWNPPRQRLERQVTNWGVSGSICATISAGISLAALASRTKTRKGRAPGVSLCAFDPRKQVGAMAPLGYWDPLSLMYEDGDPSKPFKSEETFNWYRAAEIKHGRICMMATTGLIFGTFAKWPGFENVPSGFAALDTEVGGAGMGIILIVAGTLEFIYKQDPSKEPGNLGNIWFYGTEEEGREIYTTELRNRELAHCRLAMSGLLVDFLYEYGGISPESFLRIDNSPTTLAGLGIVLGILSQFKDEKDWATLPSQLLPAVGEGAPVPKQIAEIADAEVKARQQNKQIAAASTSTGAKVTTQDADGRFRFESTSTGAKVTTQDADGRFRFAKKA